MNRYEDRLQTLQALGFSESKCRDALKSARGNVDIAADILLKDKSLNIPSIQKSRRGSKEIRRNSRKFQKKHNSLPRDERLELYRDKRNRYESDDERVSFPRDSNEHQSFKMKYATSYKNKSLKTNREYSNHSIKSLPPSPYNNWLSSESVSQERERVRSEFLRASTERSHLRPLLGRKVRDRSHSMPSIDLDEIPFFKPHMSLEMAMRLQVGDKIDHRDNVGKSLKSRIRGVNYENNNFIIHYEGWSIKWDTESHPVKELWRFSEYNTLSQRKVYIKQLKPLRNGDMIDIYPRNHPG
jgi:hypothetical protein